jgi:short subunit dehydrogenase-like uncharacterized protein
MIAVLPNNKNGISTVPTKKKKSTRQYDITVFGATGFTGKLTIEYLAKHAPKLKLAIAGRDQNKLLALKNELVALDRRNEQIGVEIASIDDEASMANLAEKTQVLATTVGPYMHYGEAAVKACADKGTDYLDLTGEPEFVDTMYRKYDTVARATKARIIHCCGFDSIPHDLGVLYAVQQLNEQVDDMVRKKVVVNGYVRAGGKISGGTWHSAVNAFSRMTKTLSPKQSWMNLTRGKEIDGRRIITAKPVIFYHRKLKSWAVPFPTIDGQVVRRSAELFEQYGRNFTYGHNVLVKNLPKVLMGLSGVSAIMALSQFNWTKQKLLDWMPQGEGPTMSERERAWFKVVIRARCDSHSVMATVKGGDPGYGETSKMLAESAITLVKDRDHLESVYGVLTPAAAMGNHLIDRLQDAGIRFSVE